MTNRVAIIIILLVITLAVPSMATIGVRASDLLNPLVPPNPVRTWGRVTSTSPVRITDGRAEVEIAGLNGVVMDDLVSVQGDWDGSVLSVNSGSENAKVYIPNARLEMVYIPAGSFLMGNSGEGDDLYEYSDESPQHSVYLSGYWIGRHEVTRGEYRRFVQAGGYDNPDYWSSQGWTWKLFYTGAEITQPLIWEDILDGCYLGPTWTYTESHPVVGVSYYEAEAFCNWAGGRLPTEAEWEKAARWDGHPRIYPWGDTWDPENCNNLDDTNPAGGGDACQPAPVGSYPADRSPYGLYDMGGNVSEWCKDAYNRYYYTYNPPGGWIDPLAISGDGDGYMVLRGGNWWDNDARCACRRYSTWYGHPWDGPNGEVGFRLARPAN